MKYLTTFLLGVQGLRNCAIAICNDVGEKCSNSHK